MRAAKLVAIALAVYLGIVVAFESLIGFLQPTNEGTLVITTTDASGNESTRVLSRLESGGQLYVAANHWPRAWYEQALENPDVEIDLDGTPAPYRAVPVTGEEHDRVERDNGVGLVFRVLTGFPPRYFLRLEPREG
jgi:hypothetical protein